MIRQIPLTSHNTCCSFPRAENHFLIFSRFNPRPSLSKAAARAELLFTDPDFPQPVYQLPDIIQPEFLFFPRSSVFPDWSSCIQGDKFHQLQAPPKPTWNGLPAFIHSCIFCLVNMLNSTHPSHLLIPGFLAVIQYNSARAFLPKASPVNTWYIF